VAGRFALIVASGAYSDPKLSRLRTPTTDAESLARVLRDPEIGDFEVDLAVDEPESALRRRIAAFFSERSRDDLLLLHFSCHGLKDDSGHLYFAATDTEVSQLDATAVSAEFVSRQMTRSRSRKVIALLDCCYSGAIARGLTFRGGDRVDLDDHLGGNGRVILTASSAMEYAFEGEELTGTGNPSVFTTAVVKGLETGEADRDQDHRISIEELYDYVCEQVREVTPDQTPNMLSHLEGELYLARSSYVAPVPAADLSPELRGAIESPLAGVREGVVSELARLLTGHDRALAEGVRGALTQLAEDDSRRVAAAAAAALGAAEAPATAPEPAPPATEPEPEPLPTPSDQRGRSTTPAGIPDRGNSRRRGEAGGEPAGRDSGVRRLPPDGDYGRAGSPRTLAPLGLTVLGALLVLATLTVFASEVQEDPLRRADIVVALAMVAAVTIPALRIRGVGRPALDALEPVLAGFPLGLGAMAGGLNELIGDHISPAMLAFCATFLLASLLWRRWREPAARPGWRLIAAAVAGAILVLASTGLYWWGDTTASDLLLWPLSVGLLIATIVGVVGVAVGRWRGGLTWAVLVAAAGGMALLAGVAALDYADHQGVESQIGVLLALLGGLVLAGAGVYALLRPSLQPGPR